MSQHLTRWLLTDGTKIDEIHLLLRSTTVHLRHMGIPVDRMLTGTLVKHPQVSGFSSTYEHPTGKSRDQMIPNETVDANLPKSNSPIGHILQTTQPMRAYLEHGQTHKMADLQHLASEGYTDYLAFPLLSQGALQGAISFATLRGGGFTDEQTAFLEQLVPALSIVIAQKVDHRIHIELLQNYLGKDAGKKVYEGRVRRGDCQNIRAAILLTDLRDYTRANHHHPPEVILSLLNDVFDISVRAIHESEGQVLKFMGDGLLAIFSNAPANIACDRAFVASQKIHRAIVELNQRRTIEKRPALDLGIGLHYGDVLYGNVGASNRQDFTVIGSAVNLAARIEALSSKLEEPTLTSSQFASYLSQSLTSCGHYPIRGIPQRMELFAVPR